MSDKVSSAVEEARSRLLSHFQQNASNQPAGWSSLWDEGTFLPWNKGFPNPALEDVLSQQQSVIGQPISSDGKRRTALVPGCGQGVDVLLLASFGYDAIGLEVGDSAVKAAEKFRDEHQDDEVYGVKDEKVGRGKVRFVKGDFFKRDWLDFEGQTFDLVYDYTFFCALPPSLRPKWSLSHTSLLSPSPHGNLICVEFPTYKDPLSGGPPWSAPSKAYMEYLSHPGEEIPLGGDGHVIANPLKEVSRDGLERVKHWKPERTHQVGMDEEGGVRDMVSIWRKIGGGRS